MSEQDFRKRYLLNWQKDNPDGRLWRINSGMGWAGKVLKSINGILSLIDYRPFHGAPKGSPDLWGYTVKEVSAPCCGSCRHYETSIKGFEIKQNCEYVLPDSFDDVDETEMPCDGEQYWPINKQKIAIFTVKELKTKKDKVSKKQQDFIDRVKAAGGIADIEREK